MILKSSLGVRGEILRVVHEDLHGALVLLEDLKMHLGNNGDFDKYDREGATV